MEGCLKSGKEVKNFFRTEEVKETFMELFFYMAKKNKKQ